MKEKLLTAVYSFLFVLGVLLLVIAWYNDPNNSMSNILLNLGTEILGSVIIFIFLDRIFMRGERSLAEEIRDLISYFKLPGHKLMRLSDRSAHDIGKSIETAKKVCLLALSAKGFMESFQPQLSKMLDKGGSLQIILVEPNSPGGQSIKESSQTNSYESDFLTSKQIISNLKNKYPKVNLKLLRWAPGCAIIVIHPKVNEEAFVQVGFYPPFFKLDSTDRLLIRFDGPTLSEWRKTYINQFEELWNSADL